MNTAPELRIFNSESAGALHEELKGLLHYVSAEYLGPQHVSGTLIDGVRHEDLQSPSFPDATFDVVISSDVFEHIPHPYDAHSEVYRILRPGGVHIMTVPFRTDGLGDVVRAISRADGTVDCIAEPEYHGDRLRPEGALVFNLFGVESLLRCERVGFDVHMLLCHDPKGGIVGGQGYVFELRKPLW